MSPSSIRILISAVAAAAAWTSASAETDVTRAQARVTAVTLNYCRASFHRIRRYQSKPVILEEKEKILNNLNLDGIANEEVIRLYTSVLQEMSQIEVAEQEQKVFQDKYRKSLARSVGSSLFILSAQLATASMEGMVRTGVNSWLDYRDLSWTRELDTWKVEKSRIQSVVEKSSRFLDTFWKLAQENEIPDRWLVRGTDLDQLAAATQEKDLQKRLRILTRMKPYMECYPPYWYYLARTQQGLGKLIEAADTYQELDKVADGHFRRDDMLAASLANLAMIRSHLGQRGAEDAAREALARSASVWEANLMCAQVLEKHGQLAAAEDAILRNLDVDLEQQNSTVALVGLFYRQDNNARLCETLSDPKLLNAVPVLSLVQCLQKLGPRQTPPAVAQRIRHSLRVAVEPRFGRDDLIIACSPSWQPQFAQVTALTSDRSLLSRPERSLHPSGEQMLRFRRAIDRNSFQAGTSLQGTVIEFNYPDPTGGTRPPRLRVHLGKPVGKSGSRAAAPWWTVASPSEISLSGIQISLMENVRPPTISATPARDPLSTTVPTGPQERLPTGIQSARTASSGFDQIHRKSVQQTPSGSHPARTSPPSDQTIPRVRILGVRAVRESAEGSPPQQVPPPPEE